MLTYLPGYFDYLDLAENTKGHSVLKRYSYGGRASSPVDDLYYESYRPRHTIYDTTGEENEIRRSVNRELMLSNHAVDDTFDLATKSRNRDQSLLRDATNAIVNSEIHASPKAAVASRRARMYHQPTVVPWSYNLQSKTTTTTTTPSQSYVRSPRREPTPRGGTPLSDDLGLPEPTSNILSWQYRLESRVPPENLLYQPKAYATVRDQIRQVQDKMDRHKQLMDRYLETDLDKPESESVQTKIMNMYVDMESRNPS